MPPSRDFADYCCELLASIGPVSVKRMFGSWGLSAHSRMVAIVSDRGGGEKLWLKANDATRGQFEASRCERFGYTAHKDGAPVQRDMNYYSAPEDAMDSPDAMAPWARLALEAALAGRIAAEDGKPAGKRAAKPRSDRRPRKA